MKDLIIETINDLSDINVSKISSISSFDDLGFDDLDLVELIMALEDKLGITADNSMYDAKTVGELVEQVNNQYVYQ